MSPLERAGAIRASAASGILAALLLLGSASHADPTPLEFRHGVSTLHELKYPPDFRHFAFVNPDAPKGGTLVMPSLTDFNTLSPLLTFERAPGSNWVHETLLLRAGDEPAAYYGSLAEQIALGADRRSIAFRLHPGARWHDGVPITSNDVKFTFDAIKADVTSSTIRMASPWFESVDIVNDREFVIRTIADPSLSLTPLASYIPIMPAHYWADKDPTKTTLTPPLGSGPYRIAAVEKGRFVRYERVGDYWGRDIPVNRGRFNFDTILYDVYRDATVAREALRKGLLDVWLQWGHDILAFDTPARDKGWLVQGKRRSRMTIGARFWLILNNRRHPFDDARVREALSLAFDFEWQDRALFAGRLNRADSYFQNSVFAATGLPSESELKLLEPLRHLVPERVFTEVFRFPRTSGVGRDRSGLMRAQALLAQAGWQMRDGVLIGADGGPLRIEFLSRVPAEQRRLMPYVDALTMLGIESRIRMVEGAQYTNRLRNRDYDAFIRIGDFGLPPWELHLSFHSRAVDAPMSFNHAGISHPAIDALVDAAKAAPSLETMAAACRALDRVLLWSFYQIPLDAVDDPHLVYWDKFGRPLREAEATYLSPFPDGWWYDPVKADRIETAD